MIRLSKLSNDTIQLLRRWRNQNHAFFVDKRLINHEEQEKWFQKYLRDYEYWYFIVYRYDEPIGSMGFSIISKDEAHIEQVILGEKKYAGQGYMSEALKQLMSIFPFKTYTLKVLKTNKSAIAFYKKNGFSIVGDNELCYIMSIPSQTA